MKLARLLDNSWLSCHRYAQRASRACEEELPFRERVGLIFHHYLCPACRRFSANLKRMQQALRDLNHRLKRGEIDGEAVLAPEVKESIQSRLKELT